MFHIIDLGEKSIIMYIHDVIPYISMINISSRAYARSIECTNQ